PAVRRSRRARPSPSPEPSADRRVMPLTGAEGGDRELSRWARRRWVALGSAVATGRAPYVAALTHRANGGSHVLTRTRWTSSASRARRHGDCRRGRGRRGRRRTRAGGLTATADPEAREPARL